ncbi:MAG TPA: helix-turn-helix domain-containing protein [Terriglobales bacterium]|nr:helix-turn-helix domain-containing protein [Terriglobales bacterium]
MTRYEPATYDGRNMGAFGERLQREREMRGITLEEISESTKITSRCLRALEEEDFDKLPGGVFNKGFVRAYAAYLGLDEDKAVADFVAASGGEKEQPLPDPPVPRAVVLGQRAEEHANWRAVSLLALLLAVAVVAAWKVGPLAYHGVFEAVETHRSTRPAPVPAAASDEAPASSPAAASITAPPAPAPAPKKAVVKARAVTVAASSPAIPSSPAPQAVAPAKPPAPAATFLVEVHAVQDAWVQIVADGRLLSEGVLVAPAEKRVQAAKEVVIKTGNAAGVEVSFNGQPLPPLGDVNQVATLTLNAGGVRR